MAAILEVSGLKKTYKNFELKNVSFSIHEDCITGFIGVNGFFKILPTGQSYHSLEMLEITKDGPKVVSKADNRNSDYVDSEIDIRYIPYEKLPKFYGKSSSEVLKWLYNN